MIASTYDPRDEAKKIILDASAWTEIDMKDQAMIQAVHDDKIVSASWLPTYGHAALLHSVNTSTNKGKEIAFTIARILQEYFDDIPGDRGKFYIDNTQEVATKFYVNPYRMLGLRMELQKELPFSGSTDRNRLPPQR